MSRLGVLATLHADGRPQLPPVVPFFDADADTVEISTGEETVKFANLRRDPRAALQVTSDDGWWVVRHTWPSTDHHDPTIGRFVHAVVGWIGASWIPCPFAGWVRPGTT